jgi:predicted metal-dependent peptidase
VTQVLPTHSTNVLTASELKVFDFNVSKAKTQIVLQHPFWAVILLKREVIYDYNVPTASINRQGQIKVNPRWAKDFTVGNLQFLLCHEVGHELFDHINRRGHRKPGRWNRAGDAVINDTLIQCKVGDFIDGGINMPGSMDQTADHIYDGFGDDDDDNPGGIGGDIDESGEPLTPEQIEEHTHELQNEIAQAAQAAKMQGKMPSVLEKLVAQILAVKTPWYEILERHMVKFIQSGYTWARPNRRYSGAGTYLPSTGQAQTMGTIVLEVDVSGSVTKKEMSYYAGHFARIVEMCNPERVHVIYVDTRVQKHVVFEQGEEVSLEYDGCGGTDMTAGFRWCAAENITPEVFVCLTDGYTGFGTDPGYPVVWCISSDKVASHGETIHFDME